MKVRRLQPRATRKAGDGLSSLGRSRIVAGVHYPSDVEEGKKLADALVSALLANDAFKRDLAAAQAEIAQKK